MDELDRLGEAAVARIDRDALVALVLDLCNIDSPVGHEGAAGARLYDWLKAEGFAPRRIGLLPDRFNVLGRLAGSGGGESLMFNAHLDTYAPTEPDLVHLDATRDELHRAWVEGDLLIGDGVVNDKGPLCAFLIAAKAIRDAGIALPGNVVLSAVIAETAHEPFEDAPGAVRDAKELGARFLATHGGIADHVLVAEGTAFGLVWVEAGKFWFKVTLRRGVAALYTPYVPKRTTIAESQNAIVAAAAAIGVLEEWAAAYEERTRASYAGGTVEAKVQMGAIRSGDPSRPFLSPQFCELFLDVRSLPGQNPLRTRDEIASALHAAGFDASVELYVFRPGAIATGVEPLVEAVSAAHRAVFGSDPPAAPPPTSSMWRDSTIFTELGIPAINYGPRSAAHAYKRALTIESLYQAACVYARTAIAICSRRV